MAAVMPETASLNASYSMIPSTSDLLMALPRLGFHLAGVFGFTIEDPTPINASNATSVVSILDKAFAENPAGKEQVLAALADKKTVMGTAGGIWAAILGFFQRLSNFDSMLSYIASRWSLSTVVLVSAPTRGSQSNPAAKPMNANR